MYQRISYIIIQLVSHMGSSAGKESACSAGDLRSIPGSERFPGEGNGIPLQCSGLEVPRMEESGGLYSPLGCKESDMTE